MHTWCADGRFISTHVEQPRTQAHFLLPARGEEPGYKATCGAAEVGDWETNVTTLPSTELSHCTVCMVYDSRHVQYSTCTMLQHIQCHNMYYNIYMTVTTSTTLHVPCYNKYNLTCAMCHVTTCTVSHYSNVTTCTGHITTMLQHLQVVCNGARLGCYGNTTTSQAASLTCAYLGWGTIHKYYMYSHKAITKGHEFM